jgi:catechol 2,3-dioxygenase-like lactoylglutathione lyase family enzyme
MIDHIGIAVGNLEKSKAFYLAALAPLGYVVVMEFPGVCGLGAGGKPDFWISEEKVTGKLHLAFVIVSKERPVVDAFHAAALAAGGTDNGGPGVRAHYHKDYYGAFAFDPDGNNLEVVCHQPA